MSNKIKTMPPAQGKTRVPQIQGSFLVCVTPMAPGARRTDMDMLILMQLAGLKPPVLDPGGSGLLPAPTKWQQLACELESSRKTSEALKFLPVM